VEDFGQVIAQVQGQSNKIMENNRSEVYEFVKRFTKWIILKEVNEKVYLEGLLEKLILELNARKNLIVKVGRANFSQMPEVIAAVEARLGNLQNVRIEIVPEINHPGIILESENGLIDGSLEGVFKNIDKIFESVVGHE
jgi:flagellar assembly protein FliH